MAHVKDSMKPYKGRWYVLCPESNICYAIFDSELEAKAFVQDEYMEHNGGPVFMGHHAGEIYSAPEYVRNFDRSPPFDVEEEMAK